MNAKEKKQIAQGIFDEALGHLDDLPDTYTAIKLTDVDKTNTAAFQITDQESGAKFKVEVKFTYLGQDDSGEDDDEDF